MSDYIEREALIADFKRMKLGENSLVEKFFADAVYAVLSAFPAADVAPVKHGTWFVRIDPTTDLLANCKCSCCGKVTHEDSDYCPNCSAKMDGCENHATD